MLKISKAVSHRFISSTLILALSTGLLSVGFATTSNTTSTAKSCGDVYAPLSPDVVSGVAKNKQDYVDISKQTNVPWELLAAIHYRETGFSRSNPANGLGIFQFTPPPKSYPKGPVSNKEFRSQLLYMAKKIQSDYALRNGAPSASLKPRKLTANEKNVALIKNTLFSYNGRSGQYANQATKYKYSKTATPYEGSPYVMNMFDCSRSGMGIITKDYGSIDGIDTRYGAFTIYARLKGEKFWKNLQKDKIGTFRFERLVGTQPAVISKGSSSLGSYTKTIAIGNKIYVFYRDDSAKTLRYALWNGTKWSDHQIDGAGATTPGATQHDVGQHIEALIYHNDIQLYYYDATSRDLRHAWSTPSGWRTETLDGSLGSLSKTDASVGTSSKALLYNGKIQLYYYDATNQSLKHTWWSDKRWHFETLDGTATSVSKKVADVGTEIEAINYKKGIQLYYYDATYRNLNHAWWSDGRWRFETMDGSAKSFGKSTATVGKTISALVYNGNLQLYYFDTTNGELKHAWWKNNQWRFEVMDGNPKSIIGNNLNTGSKITTTVFNGNLYLFYYDDAAPLGADRPNTWRVAYWSNGAWNALTLDGDSNSLSGQASTVGGELSLDIYQGNSMQVYYQDSTGNLRHAWFSE